jgi:hypothetical protein
MSIPSNGNAEFFWQLLKNKEHFWADVKLGHGVSPAFLNAVNDLDFMCKAKLMQRLIAFRDGNEVAAPPGLAPPPAAAPGSAAPAARIPVTSSVSLLFSTNPLLVGSIALKLAVAPSNGLYNFGIHYHIKDNSWPYEGTDQISLWCSSGQRDLGARQMLESISNSGANIQTLLDLCEKIGHFQLKTEIQKYLN